jgi:hypothetical protein
MKHYIVMADVLSSRNFPQIELYDNLGSLVDLANKTYSSSLLSPLTITLGDEFQCVVKSLKDACDLVFFLEEHLATSNFGFKLRFVICYGNIDTPINPVRALGMLGSGLTNARAVLTSAKKVKHRFNVLLDNAGKEEILANGLLIYQAIVDKWYSRKDKQFIATMNKEKDYKIVASKMNVSRSQTWKKYNTLNFESLFALKRMLFLVT